MSVINKVLQDLDRREAAGRRDDVAPGPVRVVEPAPQARGAFWWVLAALMVIALAWFAWVYYQLRPRAVATPAAFVAAESAVGRAATPSAEPKPQSAPAAPVAEAPSAPQRPEIFRLAGQIGAPPAERVEPQIEKAPPPQKATPQQPSTAPVAMAAEGARPPVERRERPLLPSERAEGRFRQAVALMKQGRAAEAEDGFAAALAEDPSHRASRQALVALYLERGQLEPARRLLEEALHTDPGHPDFAVALARISVERRDLAGALTTLQAVSGAEQHLEYQLLRASVLQRLERHAEASQAYQQALRLQSALPQGWVGLGISLDAQGKRAEAAEAFRRALAAGPMNAELQAFAEQRLRALR